MKTSEAAPGAVVNAGPHHVQVDARAGDEDQGHVRQDEKKEPPQREEMDRARPLPVQRPAEPAEPVRYRRTLHQASQDGRGCGDEHGDEVAELLQAVVAGPALLGRKFEREVLKRGRCRVGQHLPCRRHQPQPLIRREQQNVEDQAVDHPQQRGRKCHHRASPME